MKIVFVITRSDTIGGAHVHVADLAEWLMGKGHDVLVIFGGEGPYSEHLRSKGVPYTSSRFLRRPVSLIDDVRAVAELRHLFRQFSPDLISLHSSKAGLIGRIAAFRLLCPVLFTAHGWSFTDGIALRSAIFYRSLERFTAPLAQRIITVSEYDKKLAVGAKIASSDKFITIHNAMPDTDLIAAAGQIEGPTRIAMVARLENQKDHRLLLAALTGLQDRNWILDLIGDGPLETELRDEAVRLGLSSRINFLGLCNNVDVLLARSHIFVLTSQWEGFPRSILEAMRAGLPVIASSVGGIPESVQENRTGYLVARNDVAILTARLAYLIDHPDERARLGMAGRHEYERHYRFDRMANETLAVYRDLLRH